MTKICVAFDKIRLLHEALRLPPLNTMQQPWIYQLPDHWTFAVNATRAAMDITPSGTMGWKIEPYHVAVWFNGWAAGSFSPYGGWIAAGAAANEDAFIGAIEKEIERVSEMSTL